MNKWAIPESEYKETGKTTGRWCNACGRQIKDHKQKIFGQWVCDLVLLDNGYWVHSSRVKELVDDGHKVVHRLIENAL